MSARKAKRGLYANIHAKQQRIAHGSKEKMREPGAEGAPTAKAFKESAKTTKVAKSAKTRKAAKTAKAPKAKSPQ